MLSRHALSATLALALLTLATPLRADEGPRYFAEAKAPLPEAELDALTKKLEALSAKNEWKKGAKLATEKLGEAWCRDEIALPFRTFAALGVIARHSKNQDLAVTCALRSLFAARTEVELGMTFFELSLLIDAMNTAQFTAFREQVYALPTQSCDQKSECCYEVNSFSTLLRGLDETYYGHLPDLTDEARVPTAPAQITAQRRRLVSTLLDASFRSNPSPTLAKRLKTSDPAQSAKRVTSLLSKLPQQLPAAHRASSLKEAKAWVIRDARSGTVKIEPRRAKTYTRGKLQVTQMIIGQHAEEDCVAPSNTRQYLILHVEDTDTFSIHIDPSDYHANGCGGYGESFEIEPPTFGKETPPMLQIGSSSSSYINGTSCGASGSGTTQRIWCTIGADGTSRCLSARVTEAWDLELDYHPASSPMISFTRGRADLSLSKQPSGLRPLFEPLQSKDLVTVYEALPGIEAEVRAWFE